MKKNKLYKRINEVPEKIRALPDGVKLKVLSYAVCALAVTAFLALTRNDNE